MKFPRRPGLFLGKILRRSPRRREEQPIRSHGNATLDPASHAVDSIFQSTAGDGARVIAITGIDSGSGASTVARALAKRCALTGRKTLLVDASGMVGEVSMTVHAGGDMAGDVDTLRLRPMREELYQHRSSEFLRQLFDGVYRDYQSIIVDCAPALERPVDAIPGRLITGAVDAVILVCSGGRVTADAIDKVKTLLGPAPVRGVVINGRDQPTVGAEIEREAMRASRFFPSLARRVAAWAHRSRFLNVHA